MGAAVSRYSGVQQYYLQDLATHSWSMSGSVGSHDGGGGNDWSSGNKVLTSTLTHLKFYTHNAFDGGSISCQYMS